MCVPLGDSLDTAGSAETAAILLTGGFVEMAWTAWTAWCYLGAAVHPVVSYSRRRRRRRA
jgi:hypothetical protein